MSDPIISLQDVSKHYRLFSSKGWRVLNALGVAVPRESARDFWALRDVNLTMKRGERVGLIGRNGAGKSTLLKLIAGLIRPSGGSLRVAGRVTALMELGTGFHPDLTGMQNVRASLAYLGLTGRASETKTGEIIEFAELGDFIHQPFRTYSAGMQARLTFTVATSVRPDILIVDEILGAGDAYFSIKAAGRMQEMTSAGATLILVSHDLASVQMMCDRAAWIDRGRLVAEGDTLTLCKSYMGAVRRQEDMRLKASGSGINPDAAEKGPDKTILTGRFVTGAPSAPKKRHSIRSLRLSFSGQEQACLRLGDARDNDSAEAIYLLDAPGFTNWSPPRIGNDKVVWRDFSDEKGRYLHAPFAINLPTSHAISGPVYLDIEHAVADGEEVRVEILSGETYSTVATLSPDYDSAWNMERISLPRELLGLPESPAEDAASARNDDHIVDGDSYGEGGVKIQTVSFFSLEDEQKEERRAFLCGEDATIEINWEADIEIESCRIVVAIYRMDGRCAAQIVSSPSSRSAGRHRDQVTLSPVRLGAMEYIVSVGIFKNLQDEHRHGAEPLHVLDRRFRLKVMTQPGASLEVGEFFHDAVWQRFIT
ncbi:ABC transporter ATP-binding protein [Shinella zoogloeoides]|uniref:ATP-binding cassette domain-containing protein n=1 Tax=Shinella zoogloeoides TaxID=352475 RepID=A0A6N8THK8_SHIZO|nr:ABC transporter ATP-binding protein [Shinella zoogloeoides]MXO02722.1 ATP-binding cassette domain-containing protein [Shinella zoogloeoides]UEX81828.1 ABC transporter ATP-binding protein [Shinella zoogloeoides]